MVDDPEPEVTVAPGVVVQVEVYMEEPVVPGGPALSKQTLRART